MQALERSKVLKSVHLVLPRIQFDTDPVQAQWANGQYGKRHSTKPSQKR